MNLVKLRAVDAKEIRDKEKKKQVRILMPCHDFASASYDNFILLL
jgi:hypothetical protein